MRNGRVDSYFKTVRKDDKEESASASDCYAYLRQRIEELRTENERLREVEREIEGLRVENEDLRTSVEVELPDLKKELEGERTKRQEIEAKLHQMTIALSNCVREVARKERAEKRIQLNANCERLGKIVVERNRTSLQEVWEDGTEWKAAEQDLKSVQKERELLERKRKDIAKRKNVLAKNDCKDSDRGIMPPPRAPVNFENSMAYLEEQEEVHKVRLASLKKTESALQEKRVTLVRQRDVMLREIRRQNDERVSAFSNFPNLNNRYILLNLLGRGGFSEVYKAFDLQTSSYVACKIHQLASNWSEEKKRSFIRHAWREYKIHKSLNHPRVVKLVDIFEIDENTFCTVLEYVDGSDLDSYLRLHKTLQEKEARSIIAQVFSGLQYLAQQKRRIIHYDLKPGNILLHNGEVQITDFGLSKVMNETESTQEGMELTSQGAGTMWYLPPECFETNQIARISVKVDVWSAGVILFQMLYGRKPFGHDQTQQKIFREKTVATQELEFPSRPVVSDLAKDFMRKCLTRRATVRPDVQEALQHGFLLKR